METEDKWQTPYQPKDYNREAHQMAFSEEYRTQMMVQGKGDELSTATEDEADEKPVKA